MVEMDITRQMAAPATHQVQDVAASREIIAEQRGCRRNGCVVDMYNQARNGVKSGIVAFIHTRKIFRRKRSGSTSLVRSHGQQSLSRRAHTRCKMTILECKDSGNPIPTEVYY